VPDLSVIIVNFKGWKRLKQCLDSLSVISQENFTFEVIIIDNFSNDGIIDKYKSYYPSFLFIENSGNNGFANGCNLGASFSVSDSLLFLNPDTIVSEKALLEMVRELHVRDHSIISCRQIKENGINEKAYGRFLTPSTLTGWLRALKKLTKSKNGKSFSEDSCCIYPDWVSGSVVMISREDFQNIGEWDEDYWMYFEDVDLCKRLRNAGGSIIFLKNSVVEHNHGGATRINPFITALTKTEVIISRHLYISKHAEKYKAFIQAFLIINNIISLIIPAVFGLLFFFNNKMNTYFRIYSNLMGYYFNCLTKRTWLSKRSVNYKRLQNLQNQSPSFIL
jgi:GT2 family glycosyltransferase